MTSLGNRECPQALSLHSSIVGKNFNGKQNLPLKNELIFELIFDADSIWVYQSVENRGLAPSEIKKSLKV